VEALSVKQQEIYRKRLIIKNQSAGDGLVLIPTSSFSKNFMVQSLVDELPFTWKMIKRDKGYGKPDFLAQSYNEWRDKNVFEQLNLTDAFCLWLVKYKESIEYKKNTSYHEIITVYINQARRPKKPDDGTTDAEWVAQWERTQARAKAEGDRLFLVFLDTMLSLNDKVRLEMEWNGKYNSYVPVEYEKVPVALETRYGFYSSTVPVASLTMLA
jgi:hypothetical protein